MSEQLNAVIVDDEPQNREVLDKMLDKFCPTVKVKGMAGDVDEAVKLIHEHQPDIVFLDVVLPEENGFALFDKIPKSDQNFAVIFTTAHADYALKAIKFAALDYLLKPLSVGELRGAIARVSEAKALASSGEARNKIDVLKSNQKNEEFEFRKIALPTQEGLEFHTVNEIIRCEANRAYCIFHLTKGRRIVVSKSLKEYEEILSEANFFRLHKSNMVNVAHIKKYVKGKGGSVILSDDSEVSVAVRKKDALLKILANYKNPDF